MKIWAIANQKGGVGKTTTTLTLGALLAARGKRVLLVDMDPHGSLTAYLGHDPDALPESVYEVIYHERPLAAVRRASAVDNLWLAPASPALATLDRQFGARQGGGVVLKKALARVRNDFDYVLMDCPPTLGILMINALAAAQFLIVPVQTEFLALKGLERMERTLAMIARAREALPYLIVPTLYDKRTRASREALELLHHHYSRHLWDLVIPVDTQFRDASKQGVPLTAMNPQARGVLAFSALLDTVLEMHDNCARQTAVRKVNYG